MDQHKCDMYKKCCDIELEYFKYNEYNAADNRSNIDPENNFYNCINNDCNYFTDHNFTTKFQQIINSSMPVKIE